MGESLGKKRVERGIIIRLEHKWFVYVPIFGKSEAREPVRFLPEKYQLLF